VPLLAPTDSILLRTILPPALLHLLLLLLLVSYWCSAGIPRTIWGPAQALGSLQRVASRVR